MTRLSTSKQWLFRGNQTPNWAQITNQQGTSKSGPLSAVLGPGTAGHRLVFSPAKHLPYFLVSRIDQTNTSVVQAPKSLRHLLHHTLTYRTGCSRTSKQGAGWLLCLRAEASLQADAIPFPAQCARSLPMNNSSVRSYTLSQSVWAETRVEDCFCDGLF